ncbi:TPA: glutamine amidotransferase [Raoultella ornithinolytica]|nr:glutamine amidotransferase [Raoultella ornithinolytica]
MALRNKLLIVQTGAPPAEIEAEHGDLPQWFGRLLAPWRQQIATVRVYAGETLPDPDSQTVAVMTGSWAMVTDRLAWSEKTAAWIRSAMAVEMPLFGICYGHQLMADALGGEVAYHPAGRETGCKAITLSAAGRTDPLLSDRPAHFPAHLSHLQTVVRLPPDATVLAASAHDPHQIVRYTRHALSTQFHPEFTPEIARSLIHYRDDVLRTEGIDPRQLLDKVEACPVAAGILTCFVANYLEPDVAQA